MMLEWLLVLMVHIVRVVVLRCHIFPCIVIRRSIYWAVRIRFVHHVVVEVVQQIHVVVVQVIFIVVSLIEIVHDGAASFLLIELLKVFLHFKMGVEIDQTLANDSDKLHLMQKDRVEGGHVLLDVRAGLVNFVKEHHFLFDKVDYIIDVRSVAPNELFFLRQNHLH